METAAPAELPLMPAAISTTPAASLLLAPLLIFTSPLAEPLPLARVIAPLANSVPIRLFVIMETLLPPTIDTPAALPAADDKPEEIWTDPPTPPDPAASCTDPAASVEEPAAMEMVPDDPVEDAPVVISIEPEVCAVADPVAMVTLSLLADELEVLTVTLPLLPEALSPPAMDKDPPVP
jgi:hypothetical protein